MSRLAWLTPDAPPDGYRCVRLTVPAGIDYESAVRGALSVLGDAWNWEEFGDQTPEATAEVFREANFLTFRWENCMPIGAIIAFAGFAAPDGYMLCEGALLQIADYPELFNIIGSVHGGDGIDTFRLPDLRGRTVIGAGQGGGLSMRDVGQTPGAEKHALIFNELAPHNHTISQMTVSAVQTGPGFGWAPLATPYATNTSGSGFPHENMQPSLVENWIIRVTL